MLLARRYPLGLVRVSKVRSRQAAMLLRGVLVALWLGGCYEDRPAAPPSTHRNPPSWGASFDAGNSSAPRKPANGMNGSADAPPPAASAAGPLAPIAVEPEPNLRVAFFGDQSIGPAARSVLQLVARERAAMIVHAGDLSYGQADPRGWEAQINEVLGPSFPYIVAIGNHDVDDWLGPVGFAAILQARLERTPGLACNGELGVQSLCRFRGLELVLSGVGVRGTDHEWFLESMLARPGAAVRLCVWHENQHDMQVGAKVDEVGWGAYKVCAHHGAPIISGHEHSYARSYTLTAIGDRTREHGWTGRPDLIELAPDRTVVVVSGLGGHSSRTRTLDHVSDTWWASIYANDYQMQNAQPTGTEPLIQFGALFIDFHVDGDPRKARAYFKTADDRVVDQFEIHFAAR
jgi:Calcineurin-like phosphoesterase